MKKNKSSEEYIQQVMQRVATFEHGRSSKWLRKYIGIFIGIAFIGVILFIQTWKDLQQKDTFALFDIIHQDREIIQEFGQDTLYIIFEEISQGLFVGLTGICIILGFLFVFSSHKRKIMKRRLQESVKYRTTKNKEESMKHASIIGLALIAFAGLFVFGMKKNTPVFTNQEVKDTITDTVQVTGTTVSESTVKPNTSLTLSISSPVDKSTVTSANITVKGKTAPKAEVFVNEKETVADATGAFSVSMTLDEGENYFFVVVNDENGNMMEKELTVTYDTGE